MTPAPSVPRLVGGTRLSPHVRLSVGYELGVVDMALTATGENGAQSMWAYTHPANARAAAAWLVKAADLAEHAGETSPPPVGGRSAQRRQAVQAERKATDRRLAQWRQGEHR